jgi:hypothetical protein
MRISSVRAARSLPAGQRAIHSDSARHRLRWESASHPCEAPCCARAIVSSRALLASRSLETDVPPVVEVEVDDVVPEGDHAFRPREVPCAAHDPVFAATVDLLRERVVHVLRREGVGRLKCSARRAVQAADEDLVSLLYIRATWVELRSGDVRVPAAVQTPGHFDRRVIPKIGGWTPDRRLTRVVEHADSGYLRSPRTRGQRKAAKRQQNWQNFCYAFN